MCCEVIISSIIALVTGCLTFFATMYKCAKYVSNEIKIYQNKQIYLSKANAIKEALDFLDTYVSWLQFNSGVQPIREEVTSKDLTIKGRKIFEKLCVTCNDERIINTYCEIILNSSTDLMNNLHKFRSLSRMELGLENIEFDMKRCFISIVSTEDLIKLENGQESNTPQEAS